MRAPHTSDVAQLAQEYFPVERAAEHTAGGFGDSSQLFAAVVLSDPPDSERARESVFAAIPKQVEAMQSMFDTERWDPGEVSDLGEVRSVGSVAVYGTRIKPASPKAPRAGSVMAATAAMEMLSEYAATDSQLLWTMGPKRSEWMDQLLSGAPSASPLEAVTRFGTGGCAYGDFDLGRFFEAAEPIVRAGARNPAGDIAAQLHRKPPLQFSVFAEPGLARFGFAVPTEVIAAMVLSR